jgi:hypothetical protein
MAAPARIDAPTSATTEARIRRLVAERLGVGIDDLAPEISLVGLTPPRRRATTGSGSTGISTGTSSSR